MRGYLSGLGYVLAFFPIAIIIIGMMLVVAAFSGIAWEWDLVIIFLGGVCWICLGHHWESRS